MAAGADPFLLDGSGQVAPSPPLPSQRSGRGTCPCGGSDSPFCLLQSALEAARIAIGRVSSCTHLLIAARGINLVLRPLSDTVTHLYILDAQGLPLYDVQQLCALPPSHLSHVYLGGGCLDLSLDSEDSRCVIDLAKSIDTLRCIWLEPARPFDSATGPRPADLAGLRRVALACAAAGVVLDFSPWRRDTQHKAAMQLEVARPLSEEERGTGCCVS